jgi:hypothetical protein
MRFLLKYIIFVIGCSFLVKFAGIDILIIISISIILSFLLEIIDKLDKLNKKE